MMRNILWILVLGLGLAVSQIVWAAADRIVAVVNDQVITLSELQQRTQLAARAMGLGQVTAQQTAALQRRTLLEMVDEQLQQAYAAQQGLSLTRAELQLAKDNAIGAMGQERWQSLTAGLAKAAEAKVLAEATWARIEETAIRPQVQLGTPEVDQMILEMSKSRSRTEKNVSLIFVLRSAAEISGSKGLEAIRAEALASGATSETFAALARTYSAAPSAKDGGAMGWVLPEELPPALAQAIAGLKEGELTQPIPTSEGEVMLRVNAVREDNQPIDFTPKEERLLALLALERPSETAVVKEASAALQRATKQMKDWPAIQAFYGVSSSIEAFPRSSLLGWVPVAALQPAVREAVNNAKVGSWTRLVDDRGQLSMLFVAQSRAVMPEEVLALRERVRQSLLANRTELESRRFMRGLRQRAFVDIRL